VGVEWHAHAAAAAAAVVQVNRAARYCHAAARGGQVLVPKELMFDVVSKWINIDPVELMQVGVPPGLPVCWWLPAGL
jgi:hypothetical protein